MKILTRYILKEQLSPFFAGFLFLTFILLFNKLFLLAELIFNRNVEVFLVLKLFLLMLPDTVSLTVPMSFLIAVVMAMGRLSTDSELIALRVTGLSIYRIIRPLIISGFVVFILMLIFNETLLINSNEDYNKIFIKIVQSSPSSVIEDGIFTSFGDKTIWVEKIYRKSGKMRNVMLFSRKNNKVWDIIKAKRGMWMQNSDGSKTLVLFNGRVFSSDFENDSLSIVDFNNGRSEILLSDSKIDHNEEKGKLNPTEMTSLELYRVLKVIDKSYKEDRTVALYWVELFKKYALPFSCVVFSIIGAPLGIFSKRSGKGIGFGLSIVVFFVYYVFFMIGQSLSIRGLLHPFIGVWSANIILFFAGLLLIVYKEKSGI